MSRDVILFPYIILPVKAVTDKLPQIHKAKAEKQRERVLKEEMDAKRAKTKAARERRQERVEQKRQALTADDEETTQQQ